MTKTQRNTPTKINKNINKQTKPFTVNTQLTDSTEISHHLKFTMSGFSLNLGDPSTAQGFAARCKDIFGAILEHTPKVVPVEVDEKSDQEIQGCAASIPKAKFSGKESKNCRSF